MLSGKANMAPSVAGRHPDSLCVMLTRMVLIDCSLGKPPIAFATFAARALPSGFEAAGEDLSLVSGGAGIVMSMFLTGPSEDSGLSKSLVLPTTSTAN